MVRGEGTALYDEAGRQYLDFTAGIAVVGLGHGHPHVTQAIIDQAQTLVHCSNLYQIPLQEALADRLTEHSCLDRVFFCNSGAEANETAIKMARRYSIQTYGDQRYEIIALEGSFHGRTTGAMTATGQSKYREGFGPLMPGFTHIPPNDIAALQQAATERTCAVMLEPVQGEGGVMPLEPAYLQAVRKLCDENQWLLIMDEVQTGIGRTGNLFAYESTGIEPDILTLAKGLGNGVPIGAALAKEAVAAVMTPGTHASTFGGNPLVCRAAMATLDVLLKDGFFAYVSEMGAYLRSQLEDLAGQYSFTVGVRGKGLMLGIVLDRPAADVVKACLDKGLLLTVAGGNTVRFVPPLVVTQQEIDQAVEIVAEVLQEQEEAIRGQAMAN